MSFLTDKFRNHAFRTKKIRPICRIMQSVQRIFRKYKIGLFSLLILDKMDQTAIIIYRQWTVRTPYWILVKIELEILNNLKSTVFFQTIIYFSLVTPFTRFLRSLEIQNLFNPFFSMIKSKMQTLFHLLWYTQALSNYDNGMSFQIMQKTIRMLLRSPSF